jgi:hypothetical protein
MLARMTWKHRPHPHGPNPARERLLLALAGVSRIGVVGSLTVLGLYADRLAVPREDAR